jgi:hypothetical protein
MKISHLVQMLKCGGGNIHTFTVISLAYFLSLGMESGLKCVKSVEHAKRSNENNAVECGMNCAEDIQVSHVGKCNIGNYCNLVVML